MIRVNSVRIYQAMIDHQLGVHETCLRSRVNHKMLKKMLAGGMVRVDAVRRLSGALEIPIPELLVVTHEGQRLRDKSLGSSAPS